jgi:molybdenum cofactor synthesis domain-containing protein
MKNNRPLTVAILTVSDRCSRGESEDKSGPRLCEIVLAKKWDVEEMEVVPDEKDEIQDALLAWCDKGTISLILTTGGTGLSPRDVTPQATREIVDKEIPGLAELMRSEGRKFNQFSVLSQAVVGVRRKTLIINLPGNPAGAEQALGIIMEMIPHALHIMAGGDHHHKDRVTEQSRLRCKSWKREARHAHTA